MINIIDTLNCYSDLWLNSIREKVHAQLKIHNILTAILFFLFKNDYFYNQQQCLLKALPFFAYFSTHNIASSPHHIFAFDKVITNIGNAYHPHSGSFLAPRSGVYVLVWTIRLDGNSNHGTELLHDNNIINSIYLKSANVISGTATGTAVVQVNQGEDVLIRTVDISNGRIFSDAHGRSSFAGLILM